MKIYAKKRMLVLAIACLVGFQPTVKAEDPYRGLILLAGIFVLCSGKIIVHKSVELLRYLMSAGYASYRKAKYYRYHSESDELRAAKTCFKKNLKELDLVKQHAWSDNCYSQLFSKEPNAVKTVENFIESQE